MQAATLAENCMTCHGLNGKGQGAIPQLAGKPQDFLQTSMLEFASGARPGTIMRIIARKPPGWITRWVLRHD